MAKKSTEDQFKAWQAEYESKLKTDEQKAAFKALVSDDETGKELFGGFLRESDYYRRLNEHNAQVKEYEKARNDFQAQASEQEKWWKQAKPEYDRAVKTAQDAAAELARSRAQLDQYGLLEKEDSMKPVTNSQTFQPSQEFLAEHENLKQTVTAMNANLPRLLASLSRITQETIKGGYDVNPEQVIKYSLENGIDPDRAFEVLTAETRQERAAEDLKKQLEAARAEGRREAMSKQSAPDYIRPAMAGPSASLFGKEIGAITDSSKRKDAAVQAFLELESQS